MQKLSKLKQASQIVRNMGWRYIRFRGSFELKKKLGLLQKKFPVNPSVLTNFISLEEWRLEKKPFFKPDSQKINIDLEQLEFQANQIRSGNILFFSSTWYNLGLDYDWVTNPDNGYKYDANLHWTRINDFSKVAGDIKYVWEKSRFSFVHTLIRDDHWNKHDNAEFIFKEIESWIDHNPINCGPNYKCSQEISLRVLNWIWVLYYYSGHAALTEQRWNKISHAIYWQIHHVYNNIHFSRIAVRNNHAITETLTLYIVAMLFPWFNDSAKWKRKGKEWFEKEITYQVYEDGTFLQFSMNYHRVLIQLFSWAIGISDLNNEKFKDVVYERAYHSLNFLYQCQEDSNGMLPNYGANDGALFFPLNGCHYRDYRPQLNALHKQLCGSGLYENGVEKWNEDALWLVDNTTSPKRKSFPALKKTKGCISFDIGGYYLIRDTDSLTFIRCGNHKDRPSHADNLHMDVWVNGENILIDAGSYKYNTDDQTLRYFTGTASHNTVMIGDKDQMLKGSRFIWYYWTQVIGKPILVETAYDYSFIGKISCFRYFDEHIVHTRTIKKKKGLNQWHVSDMVNSLPQDETVQQIWHIASGGETRVKINSSANNNFLDPIMSNGFSSEMYGRKEISSTVTFISKEKEIETHISIE